MELHFPLLLDGATGTELQKRGCTGEVCFEQWTLEHPEDILEIQRGYVKAGSQVLYTPTFGANRRRLESHGIFNRTAEFNRRLAALSAQAAEGRALCAGDLSPTGAFLPPLGNAAFEELADIYAEQVAALEDARVDLFVIETMMTLPDARAAVLAVRRVSRKPVFVTFTCDKNGRSVSGTDVAAALVVLQGMGIDGFGLNCAAGPAEMVPQLKRLQRLARVPLIAKPNAGTPRFVEGRAVYDCTPEALAAWVPELLDAGVAVFGGCCGTTAAHIAALRDALEGAVITTPDPAHTDKLVAATERDVFFLPAEVGRDGAIRLDGNAEEALTDAAESGEAVIAIRIDSREDVQRLAEWQHMVTKPVCFVCEDAELLESALRLYQGRALYSGSLGADVLLPLCGKYGVLV